VRAFVLVLVQDLRLGLDLETAQLLLEARHRARQLPQVEIERAELLLEARTRNARLTRDVQHLVEQIRVHARHLRALAPRHWLAARRDRLRREQTLLAVQLGCAATREHRRQPGRIRIRLCDFLVRPAQPGPRPGSA